MAIVFSQDFLILRSRQGRRVSKDEEIRQPSNRPIPRDGPAGLLRKRCWTLDAAAGRRQTRRNLSCTGDSMAHDAPLSPLAPKAPPEVSPLDGVRFAAGAAGVRYAGRTDVMLAILDEGTTVAGVFTKSKCPSAPVDWCRARLKGGKARALVVNSGNANAFTGKTGAEAVKFTAKLAAAATGAQRPARFFSPRPASSASRSMPRNSTACWRSSRDAAARRLARGRQRHHDDRHLSQSSRRAARRSAAWR